MFKHVVLSRVLVIDCFYSCMCDQPKHFLPVLSATTARPCTLPSPPFFPPSPDAKQRAETELGPQTRSRSNTLPRSFGSTLDRGSYDAAAEVKGPRPTKEETLELIQRRVNGKRQEDGWPDDIKVSGTGSRMKVRGVTLQSPCRTTQMTLCNSNKEIQQHDPRCLINASLSQFQQKLNKRFHT